MHLSCVSNLSWNNEAWYAENVAFFLPFSILKWLHKNSPIFIFFKKMNVDMKAATKQSNRSSYRKKKTEEAFGQTYRSTLGSGSREVWLWIMVRDLQHCWSDNGWREAMSQGMQIIWKETWYKKLDSSPKPQKWCGPAEILIPTGRSCWTLTLQNSKAINICCFQLAWI